MAMSTDWNPPTSIDCNTGRPEPIAYGAKDSTGRLIAVATLTVEGDGKRIDTGGCARAVA